MRRRQQCETPDTLCMHCLPFGSGQPVISVERARDYEDVRTYVPLVVVGMLTIAVSVTCCYVKHFMAIRIAVVALYIGAYQSAKPWGGSWRLAWQVIWIWGIWWVWGAAFDSVWPQHHTEVDSLKMDTCSLGLMGTLVRALMLLSGAYIITMDDAYSGRAAAIFMVATLCSGTRQAELLDAIPSVIIRTTLFCLTHSLSTLVLDNTETGRDGTGVRIALATAHILFGNDTISLAAGTCQTIYMAVRFSKIFEVPSAKRMNEEKTFDEETGEKEEQKCDIPTDFKKSDTVDMTRLLALAANANAV